MKILVVDETTTIRALIRRALARLRHPDIAEAQNGLEALAEIGRRRFELAILDVNVPVMDGLETLEAIRAAAPHARFVGRPMEDMMSRPLTVCAQAETQGDSPRDCPAIRRR